LLINLITQGPASEAYETLRFMYIFTPISRSNVCKICNIKLLNCSTILIYFYLYVYHQAARPLPPHSEPFNIKLQTVNGNYHLLNVPANIVFNKKVVFIPLKKNMVLNSSVLNSGGPYHSVLFCVATQ
jgi:hypothetical protein